MVIRTIRKNLIRPAFRAAALAFLWERRVDAARWGRFAKRLATEPASRPTKDDLITELRARAAIASDPELRNDRALTDVLVRDGVVVLGAPDQWRHRARAIALLETVKGVRAVHAIPDVTESDLLGIDHAQLADGRHVSVAS